MNTLKDSGRMLAHAQLSIDLNGYPELVPGVVNNAIDLNGNNQYIDLGTHNDECMGNLNECNFGISLFFWLKIHDYEDNMYILSTGLNGIRIYYNQDYIYITVDNLKESWRISTPKFETDEWHFIELSWHPDAGLSFYIDGKLQDHVHSREIPLQTLREQSQFYIGRPNNLDIQGLRRYSYGNMAIDELEIWYARRDALIAFDYIIRGKFKIVEIIFSQKLV